MRPTLQWASRMWAHWPFPLGPAVAVIGYHRVDDVDHHLAVSTRGFATHVAVLAGQRASQPVLDLDEALDRLNDGTAPRRAVVVTFDDAWADYHANALGPLVEHAIPSTMYVPSRLLDRPGHLGRGQLLEMAGAGVRIGAHSRTHVDLVTCSNAELEREVRGSREDLEDLLGKPVTRFAYPAGRHDARVRAAVAAAGFRSALLASRGWARASQDWYQVPRNIMEEFDRRTFEAAIRGGLNYLAPVEAVRQRLGARGS
jgi:peptidoglycan/xylan/chitin deacetylase (PgdA/CDA1 family)